MNRDDYVEQMKAKLDEWNAEIDKLQAQAKDAEEEAKEKYEAQLAEMRKQRDEAQAKMKEAQPRPMRHGMTCKRAFRTLGKKSRIRFSKRGNAFNNQGLRIDEDLVSERPVPVRR